MEAPATGKRVALAAVAGAHGVKGEVRLKLFADSVASLARHRRVFVGGTPMDLLDVRDGGKTAIARLAGIADRSAVEALRGQLVEIDRSELPPLEDGEYYHADLIGLPVIDANGLTLGSVVAVENFGAGDLLEVRVGDRRHLIPFRDGVADLVEGRVVVDAAFLA